LRQFDYNFELHRWICVCFVVVRDILAKTARKMSPLGLAAAGKLTLDARLAKLLTQALATRLAD
jgi:hypothetical protein